MDHKAFNAAKEKLATAKAKLEAMRHAFTPAAQMASWEEWLAAQHRVFTRLRKATEKGPSKGWFDKIISQQRSDELLSYILHARDANEHGIENVIQHRGVTVVSPVPGPSGPIPQVRVMMIPPHVRIVAVVDRGARYRVPKVHLGKPMAKTDPITIAELAIAYLDSKIIEAEAKWGQHP